jgi:hypothetical protein
MRVRVSEHARSRKVLMGDILGTDRSTCSSSSPAPSPTSCIHRNRGQGPPESHSQCALRACCRCVAPRSEPQARAARPMLDYGVCSIVTRINVLQWTHSGYGCVVRRRHRRRRLHHRVERFLSIASHRLIVGGSPTLGQPHARVRREAA